VVTIDDMNFATGMVILIAINAIIAAPLALIIAAIIFFAVKKRQDYTYGEVFWPTLQIGAGVLTTATIIYLVVMYFKG